jgi:hypothetical protein
MPFQAYARFLVGHGVPMNGVVTEARFDTSQSVPVLTFRAVRPLTREEWETAKQQGQSHDAIQALEVKYAAVAPKAAPALPPTFTKEATAAVAKPAEPVKRETKKADAPVPKSVDAVLAAWSSDDDE